MVFNGWVEWTLVTDSAPFFPRALHTAVVFDDKMWVLGGHFTSEGTHSIRFSAINQPVDLKIYNISGKLVRSITVKTNNQQAITVTWNGTDNFQKRLPAGVYFLRLEIKHYQTTKKIILTR